MGTVLWTVFLFAFIWSQWGHVGRGGTEDEMRSLLNATLNNTAYSSRVRPISDTGNTLQVKIDLYLVAINDIDEVEQKMTTTAYLSIEWPDAFITWTPTDYGNINTITIPQYRLWKPDIALSNAYDTITGMGSKFMYVSIDPTGTVTWRPYQVFESSCSLDMTYFPFDEQTCDLLLATWSSTKEMIGLITGSVGFNIDNYATNANWDLVGVSTYDSSTSTTSGLAFRMKLKRKPVYFLINFLIPILLLSSLNIFAFVLPCDSGEKASYAIVLFLSFAIFLLIVTDLMPEGMTTVPVISTYLMIECIISTLIVFLTLIQLRLHNMGDDTEVPRILKKFVGAINTLRGKLKFKCCNGKENGDGDEEESNYDEKKGYKNSAVAVIADKPEKVKIAPDEQNGSVKRIIPVKKTDSRFKDLIYGRKISPQVVFRKPVVHSTPYDRDIELQDLEDKIFSETIPKRKQMNHAVANAPPANPFVAKRQQNLTSESDLSELPSEEDKDDDTVEWSDVTGAMDWFFVCLFTFVTILLTAVVLILLITI